MSNNTLIFGDSYSTFKGYIPEGYATWYPDNDRCDTVFVFGGTKKQVTAAAVAAIQKTIFFLIHRKVFTLSPKIDFLQLNYYMAKKPMNMAILYCFFKTRLLQCAWVII